MNTSIKAQKEELPRELSHYWEESDRLMSHFMQMRLWIDGFGSCSVLPRFLRLQIFKALKGSSFSTEEHMNSSPMLEARIIDSLS